MPETAAWLAGPLAGRADPPKYDPYPERPVEKLTPLDRKVVAALSPKFRRLTLPRLKSYWRRVDECNRIARQIAELDDASLDSEINRMRIPLRVSQGLASQTEIALALVREVCFRSLGMRPYDVQILAALALYDGRLAEMETGEGKSLVAAITAAVAALGGTSAHVVTVNDYLALRDAETFAPLFQRLGLSSSSIVHEHTPDQRRAIYKQDIIYISNKEVAFDYLRDRVRMAGTPDRLGLKLNRLGGGNRSQDAMPVLNGLHFAIVDEADSVLIDEARTPLILSRETDAAEEERWADDTFRLLDGLTEDKDFKVDLREHRVTLTDQGKEHLDKATGGMEGRWRNRVQREGAVRQAIQARQLLSKGDQYVVKDDKVVIVDEYTGRLMPERSWNDGLHQLIEVKEGVPVTSQKLTLARMTYQRFFSRYIRLAGMTGTAREVAEEMSSCYRIDYLSIPPRLHSRMRVGQTRIARNQREKLDLIVSQAKKCVAEGRPVLVGTRSISMSEAVSQALEAASIPHETMNALNDEKEAEIVAEAGQTARVTVATNMAGRGVHIEVPSSVEHLGGLHVILTERHDSRRIDRQLMGRTARQGQQGSFEAILARDDAILAGNRAPISRCIGALGGPFRFAADLYRFRKAQNGATRLNARARRMLLDHDRNLEQLLAFAGGAE